MIMEDFREKLRGQAESLGAAYFSVADLTGVKKFVVDQGGEFLAQFPRAVSVGYPLANAVVGQLHQHENEFVARCYHHHIYTAVTNQLDQITLRCATLIQEKGYQAFPVLSRGSFDRKRHCGIFSHKLAGHLAGLGWIGKSCLLVTPDRGVRVRWATVLTDADLPAKRAIAKDGCGKCRACVDICPVHAYTGRPFSPDEPRELRFDAQKCHEYLSEREKRVQERVCGLCIQACPIGRGNRPKTRSGRLEQEGSKAADAKG
jgi:epoxyqueuosine reductase